MNFIMLESRRYKPVLTNAISVSDIDGFSEYSVKPSKELPGMTKYHSVAFTFLWIL